jgi:hypothetical protein
MRVKMKRTMAVFPPVCGKEVDRSVGGDMLTKDSSALDVCVQELYTCIVAKQKGVGD